MIIKDLSFGEANCSLRLRTKKPPTGGFFICAILITTLIMYRDVAQSKVDHCVVVSNDSDLAPVLGLIENDFPHVVRGVILPTLEMHRKARRSGQLSNLSTWTRRYLKTSDLEKCQLPPSIRNRKGKAILRPAE